ncbi:MAG: hypothetical protein ABEK17_03390 [Candidatus Aenigmatarchaeota archaeon]
MCFKSLSKAKIKILSYIDIFIGLTFTLLGIVGFFVLLGQGFDIVEPRLIDLAFNTIFAGLLLFSGIILIERETEQNATYTGWIAGTLGFFFLIDTGMTFVVPTVDIPNIVFVFGSLIGILGYVVLTVSGYYLRKLL